MNRNNNAATMQDIIQRVNSDPKIMHSVGSTSKDQGIATTPGIIRANFNANNLPHHQYTGGDGFASTAAVVQLPSSSQVEFQNGSPPLFRSNPRPYHSPSRSLSMPPVSSSRPLNFAQFNVRHAPQSSPLSPYSTYPGGNPVMPLQPGPTASDRYRLINNNHPPHIVPRFQGSLAGCPSNNGPHYRPPGDLVAMRAPYSATLLAGASSIGGNNPSTDKEQKETTNTRKKRKACGHCEPCRRKENCGSCMNCINRAKGKQICIHRKCEILKKKPGTSSYLSACNPTQDKRKEIDSSLLPKQAKRSKINDSSERSASLNHPTLHPNFSEFGDLSQTFLSPPFNDRSVLTSGRPDLPTSSDNFSSYLAVSPSTANSFKQICAQPDIVIPSSTSLPASVEETDFIINQTLHEIENNIQKSDHSSLSTFINSNNSTPQTSSKNDEAFSHFHQLQNISWNDDDLADKLLKPLTTAHEAPGHTTVELASGNTEAAKSDPLLESLSSFNPKNSFENDSVASFKTDFSISKSLPQNANSAHSATSSISPQDISESDQFLVGNQLQSQQVKGEENPKPTFQQNLVPYSNSQSLNSDMSYDPALVGQLNSPLLAPNATALSNPSLLYNDNTVQSSQIMSSLQGNFHYSQINMVTQAPPIGQNNFGQYGLGQDGQFSPNLNSISTLNDWTCQPRPMHCTSAFPAIHSDSGQQLSGNRPSDVQQTTNYPSRKISSNSSDSFRLQRHLSAGSGGSNQSPMMQASPGAGSAPLSHSVLPPSGNLKSPMSGIPSGSPAPSHLSGMMGSPATSVHISPTQSQSPFTPAPPQYSVFLSDREFQRHDQGSWPDQHKPDPSQTSTFNYQAHVAHSIALTENYAQKPCTPPLHPNPVPNHFLTQPGSGLKSPSANVPCSESTAIQSVPPARTECSFSSAAVRLSQTESQIKDDSAGPTLSNNHSVSTAQQQAFAETMNSILYGDTKSEGNAQSFPSNSKGKSEVLQIKAGPLIESPTDVHSTISPGESGYDSTEPGSVASDNLSQHGSSAPSGNTPIAQAKNLQAALTENKDQRIFSFDNCQGTVATTQPVSDSSNVCWLPVKAASNQAFGLNTPKSFQSEKFNNLPQAICPNRETNSTPACFSVANRVTTPHAPFKTTLRSLSFDCGRSEKVNFDEDDRTKRDKQTLPLRRYSFQGPDPSQNICKMFTANTSALLPLQVMSNVNTKTEIDVSANSFHPFGKSPTLTQPAPPMNTGGDRTVTNSKISSNKLPSSVGFPCPTSRSECNMLTTDDLRGRVISYKAANGNIKEKTIFPQCKCLADGGVGDDAPYYTHLGAAPGIEGIRTLFEERTGYRGDALRIERVFYTGKEGKTSHGCPIAKWVIRRASIDEKVLIICRHRPGHRCATAYMVVVIVLWEGIDSQLADETYEKCTTLIPTNGEATERRCGTNEERTCACQGFNADQGGASFSFGCSWSMYYNGCKYARSVNPNKFKLNGSKDRNAENSVEDFCQDLATRISNVYKKAAPEAHRNQTELEHEGFECRLGKNPVGKGRPFSGVTCCMDFCAHSHKDRHNMENGTTVVLTLTKPENREIGKRPSDEQLHVLPLYRWDASNESGTLDGIGEKIKSGAIEILTGFRRAVRLRDKPQGTCKQRKERKKRAELAGCVITPKKRKGRKPKRSLSMEDISALGHADVNSVKQQPYDDLNSSFPQCDSPAQLYESAHHQSASSYYHPEYNPTATPPPRWPYRRQTSVSNETENLFPQSNLPSIGSFFGSPTSPLVGKPNDSNPSLPPAYHSPSPQQSFHFGRRLSSTSPSPFGLHLSSPASDGHSSVPPNMNTGYFGSTPPVKSEPLCDPYAWYTEPAEEEPVALKSYARLTSRVKQEPVADMTVPPHVEEFPSKIPLPVDREHFSDSEESFHNPDIGGVAIAPGHGSIIIECAKRELHATTSLLKPDRFHPSRVSLVFYQHKNMNHRNHGAAEYEAKEAKRSLEKAEKLRREADEKALAEKQAAGRNENLSLPPPSLQHHINPAIQSSNGFNDINFNASYQPRYAGHLPNHSMNGYQHNSSVNHTSTWPQCNFRPRIQQTPSASVFMRPTNAPRGHGPTLQTVGMSDHGPTVGSSMPVYTLSNHSRVAVPPLYQSLPSGRSAYHPPRFVTNSSADLCYRPRTPTFPVYAIASDTSRFPYQSVSHQTLAELNQRSYPGPHVIRPLSVVSPNRTEKPTRYFTVL